ncbi:hypothetical protein Tco_1106246 [Tanacetum coccineum]
MVRYITGKPATYGRIWDDDKVQNPGYVETEFPAIVFDSTSLLSEAALSCETYVDMPLLPSPEPTVGYFDDLNYLKDFENEFPAIVYNDAQTSKFDFLTEPIVSPQHIDEFDLKDETSLSEYDEEEQNILYFNDLFPFNITYLDDLKSDKDNDDNEVDIIQSSGGKLVSKNGYDVLDIPLPPRDQRHQYLRFEGLEYTDADITDFEERLGRIYGREIHRVQVFYFGGLTDLMAEGLSGGVRRRLSRREFILGMGLHTTEEIESVGFGAYWAESARQIPDKGDLSAYWVGISSAGNFLGTTPSYTLIKDLMLRLYHRLIAYNIAGRTHVPERYLRMFYSGRKREAMISGV